MTESLDAALQALFSFYSAGLSARTGVLDSQVRQPAILGGLIAAQGLLPASEKTIVVTGSKGKGTTARHIAWHLQAAGWRVGLVVSPQELHHTDRLRINNQAIAPGVFSRYVSALLPTWQRSQKEAAAESLYYHSPSDLFLHVGLAWFKEQQVDFVVIEGGRGARYDLISRIPAKLGIVTSIFLEHAAFLGDCEAKIAADKFSLLQSCQTVMSVRSVAQWLAPNFVNQVNWIDAHADEPQSAQSKTLGHEVDQAPSSIVLPAWLTQARRLAKAAVGVFGVSATQQWDSPSFSQIGRFILDGAIAPPALDHALLAWLAARKTAVVLGLSHDKAVMAVSGQLRECGLGQQFQVHLCSGDRDLSEPKLAIPSLGQIDLSNEFSVVHAPHSLQSSLLALASQYDPVYCVGVQQFLRQVRAALGQQHLVGPQ